MSNWLMSVWESFEKAFLVSDRYSAYLDGFKTTLIISFFAVLLGVGVGLILAVIKYTQIIWKKISYCPSLTG